MLSNDATIQNIKHEILYEVAKLAYAGRFEEEKDELAYKMFPGPKARFRCCVKPHVPTVHFLTIS